MVRGKAVIFGVALAVAGLVAGASPGSAQTFQNYRCADGTKFIVGFFDFDSRAHMQVDGGAVTLAKRFAVTGVRYTGHGVTMQITKTGTTLKHAKRPVTTCDVV